MGIDKKMGKVTVELSEEQAKIVNTALDTYGRILLGQLGIVEEVLRFSKSGFLMEEDRYTQLGNVRDKLNDVKKYLGLPYNGHHGIHSDKVDDVARQAFDIKQVIRHSLSWGRQGKDPNTDERVFSEMMSVDFDTPRKTSIDKDFELPKVSYNV